MMTTESSHQGRKRVVTVLPNWRFWWHSRGTSEPICLVQQIYEKLLHSQSQPRPKILNEVLVIRRLETVNAESFIEVGVAVIFGTYSGLIYSKDASLSVNLRRRR